MTEIEFRNQYCGVLAPVAKDSLTRGSNRYGLLRVPGMFELVRYLHHVINISNTS